MCIYVYVCTYECSCNKSNNEFCIYTYLYFQLIAIIVVFHFLLLLLLAFCNNFYHPLLYTEAANEQFICLPLLKLSAAFLLPLFFRYVSPALVFHSLAPFITLHLFWMLNVLKLVRNDVENCKFFDYLVTIVVFCFYAASSSPTSKRFCFICVVRHLWPPPKVCCNLLLTLVINMRTYAITHTHTYSRTHSLTHEITCLLPAFKSSWNIHASSSFSAPDPVFCFSTNLCACICAKFNEFLWAIDGCQLFWLYSAIAWDLLITLISFFISINYYSLLVRKNPIYWIWKSKCCLCQ